MSGYQGLVDFHRMPQSSTAVCGLVVVVVFYITKKNKKHVEYQNYTVLPFVQFSFNLK